MTNELCFFQNFHFYVGNIPILKYQPGSLLIATKLLWIWKLGGLISKQSNASEHVQQINMNPFSGILGVFQQRI